MAKSREQYIAENTDDYEGDLYSFALVDRKTVERLQKDGDITLPYKDLDKIKDERWNTKLFTSRLLQGILNGDPIPNIAARLLDVVGYNEASAMRNARTMTTACENRGRQDSYEELADNGVVQKKVWIATPDDRTRASHLEIDGEEVDIDAEFSNGLKYPADPDGDESEVYNCRCSMRDHIVGFRRADGSISYIGHERDYTMHAEQIEQEREARSVEPKEKAEPKTATESTFDALKDAYTYHNAHNGLSRTSVDDLGDAIEYTISANYGKLSEQSQAEISDTLTGLMSKYDTPLTHVRTMTRDEFMQQGNSFAYVYHDYSTDVATMVFNPTKTRDYDEMISRLQELKENGYIPQISDDMLGHYIPTHEFAHTFLDMESELKTKRNFVDADYGKIKSIRKDMGKLYDEYAETVGKLEEQKNEYELKYLMGGATDEDLANKAIELEDALAKIKISDYSLTNPDEFMAEAFAHNQLGGSDNEYVNRVMDIINSNFKRR